MRPFHALAHVMQISDAARRCGLTARAVRLYEQRGMIVAGRDFSGRRVYDAAALERLAFVAEGRRLGLTLAQIAAVLEEGDRRGPQARADALMQVCSRRLAELEAQRAGLRSVLSMPGAAPRSYAAANA